MVRTAFEGSAALMWEKVMRGRFLAEILETSRTKFVTGVARAGAEALEQWGRPRVEAGAGACGK